LDFARRDCFQTTIMHKQRVTFAEGDNICRCEMFGLRHGSLPCPLNSSGHNFKVHTSITRGTVLFPRGPYGKWPDEDGIVSEDETPDETVTCFDSRFEIDDDGTWSDSFDNVDEDLVLPMETQRIERPKKHSRRLAGMNEIFIVAACLMLLSVLPITAAIQDDGEADKDPPREVTSDSPWSLIGTGIAMLCSNWATYVTSWVDYAGPPLYQIAVVANYWFRELLAHFIVSTFMILLIMTFIWIFFAIFSGIRHLIRWLRNRLKAKRLVGDVVVETEPPVIVGDSWHLYTDPLTSTQSFQIEAVVNGERVRITVPPGTSVPPLNNTPAAVPDGLERAVHNNPVLKTELPKGHVCFRNADGKVIGMGCRVKVGKATYVLTARHVLHALKNVYNPKLSSAKKQVPMQPDWKVVTYSNEADFALLHVPDEFWPFLEVAALDLGSLGLNESVHAVGPLGTGFGIAYGTVDPSLSKNLNLYHSISTDVGWSGAPIISGRAVVGLHLGFNKDDPTTPLNRGLSTSFLVNTKLDSETSFQRESPWKQRMFIEDRLEDPDEYFDYRTGKGKIRVASKGSRFSKSLKDPYGGFQSATGMNWRDIPTDDELDEGSYDQGDVYGNMFDDSKYHLPAKKRRGGVFGESNGSPDFHLGTLLKATSASRPPFAYSRTTTVGKPSVSPSETSGNVATQSPAKEEPKPDPKPNSRRNRKRNSKNSVGTSGPSETAKPN